MKKSIQLIDQFISHYAKLDSLSEQYVLPLHLIPDFDLHEVTALLMVEEKEMAIEALGPDNKAFDQGMLSSLLSMLNDSTNKDEKTNFVYEWKKGVTTYFIPLIEKLVDERIEHYNQDLGHTKNAEPNNRYFGEAHTIW